GGSSVFGNSRIAARLLLSTLTSKKIIRHCEHEARSVKQSEALLESKTVQIIHKFSNPLPVPIFHREARAGSNPLPGF
ncbi:MAG: hypothetical protein AAB347_11865, partial [Bacteroidota bacterium]